MFVCFFWIFLVWFYVCLLSEPSQGYLPDCANITGTLTAHAAQIVALGFDHVVVDGTNLASPGPMQPPACPGDNCEGMSLQTPTV